MKGGGCLYRGEKGDKEVDLAGGGGVSEGGGGGRLLGGVGYMGEI